ncbi:MAG TPA: hypothetical protein VGK74_25920 [Symbiobacteriaceae bacterium]|jgi:hypothetical protein
MKKKLVALLLVLVALLAVAGTASAGAMNGGIVWDMSGKKIK